MSSSEPSGPWRVVGASVCGLSHERLGRPCQDAHCWRLVSPGDVLVAAVADSVGSAELGEVGAEIAARTAVGAVCRDLADGVLPGEEGFWAARLKAAVAEALDAVNHEAAQRAVPPRALASTLILVVASPQGAAAAQVGDGAAVVAHDAELTALTTPDTGEYLNETIFLVSPGALDRVQFRLHEGPVHHLALFSDGLEMLALKMPAGVPHGPFFAPLFRFAGQAAEPEAARGDLERFLLSPRVRERADDDLTLLLAALGERSGSGAT